MKILQLFNRFPWPLRDGGAIANYHESMGYLKVGAELCMASLNTSKHFIKYEDIPADLRNRAQIHLSYIDNEVKPKDALLNLFSDSSYHVDRFISKDFEILLAEICQNNTFDVVIFESVFMAPYLPIIRQHTKALCVLREHNVEYKIWENLAAHCKFSLKRKYLQLLAERLKRFELSVVNSFDAITVFSLDDLVMLREDKCQVPIEVFPVGIDVDNFVINQENLEMPSLFHLGSMDWMPNQEAMKWFIEEVWYDINAEFPDLHFYLGGRNLPTHFFDFNNQNNIRVVGEVENAHDFMNSKAIMIVPLFSGSGIRVKILEGMALGKCVISTKLGAQGIVAKPGQEILYAEDEEQFKEQITYLMESPEQVARIGRNARELVKKRYDNKTIILEKLNYYSRIMDRIRG